MSAEESATFELAERAFEAAPSKRTAGDYLSAALHYESEGEIGDDTFLDAIGAVAKWLSEGEDFS